MESFLQNYSAAYLKVPNLSTACKPYLIFTSPSSSFACTSSWRPWSTQKPLQGRPGKSVTVVVKAKSKDDKEDSHSSVPKPDESTWFFPEAVLLKEKKVQEDGRALPEFADAEEQQLYEALMLEMESGLDVEEMRHYEVVYLIHEEHENEVGSVSEKVEEFLRQKKGKIWRLNDWGMRRLSYKIKKARSAHYILMNFELDSKWINDFKTLLDKDERVIRHLVVKRDEAITKDCPSPPDFYNLRGYIDDYDEEEEEEEDNAEYDEVYEDEDHGDDGDAEFKTEEIDGFDDDAEEESVVIGDDSDSAYNISGIVRQPARKLENQKIGR